MKEPVPVLDEDSGEDEEEVRGAVV